MTRDDVIKAAIAKWNSAADDQNQWEELGADEIIYNVAEYAAEKINDLTAQLEAVGAGGVGPLIAKPAKTRPDDAAEAFEAYAAGFDTLGNEWQDMGANQYFEAGFKASITQSVLPPIPAGHVLVPIEPTPEMISQGKDAQLFSPTHKSALVVYRAMIAARPQQKA